MKKSLAVSLIAAGLASFASANLVVNGDFEAGNTGFTSSYTYVSPGYNVLYPEGTYTVDTNAANNHNLFASFGDHTSGQGNYMIVNGSVNTGLDVYATVTVAGLTAGSTYSLSAWVTNVYPDNPASLDFSVDSNNVGTISPVGLGTWQQFSTTFVATGSTASISILDTNQIAHGNDFGIDDISVEAVPEPATMAVLGLGAAALLRRRRKA